MKRILSFRGGSAAATKKDGGANPRSSSGGGSHLVEDLCELDEIERNSVLSQLERRFEDWQPYTSLGGIVLAVNPHRWLDQYGDEAAAQYAGHPVGQPAHVFSVSAQAYHRLADGQGNQCVLVSGVAGAGKTETAKLLHSHLVRIAGRKGSTREEEVVRASTRLLEAFGNAVMVDNENSSRVGVVTRLQFDSHQSSPTFLGSVVKTYLLEKSRVVAHDSAERNFHILYYLMACPNEELRTQIGLGGCRGGTFSFLKTQVSPLPSDRTGLEDIRACLRSLGLGLVHQLDIFKALAGVLHLGEIKFFMAEGRADEAGQVDPSTLDSLKKAAHLLGVRLADLERVLTFRTIQAGSETMEVPLKPDGAREARDAIAKAVYLMVFEFVVSRINASSICHEETNIGPRATSVSSANIGTISLVDVFGFETVEKGRNGGFEQLLINFSSEVLQQKFLFDVFKETEAAARREGVSYESIAYLDNEHVLAALQGPQGVISLLDQVCLLPHATDSSFGGLLRTELLPRAPEALPQADSHTFTIQHHSHAVMYTTDDFLVKNKDRLLPDASDLLLRSKNPVVHPEQPEVPVWSLSEPSPSRGGKRTSVASIFRRELHELVKEMNESEVQYVWCLRPNRKASPVDFDREFVSEQLRCASIIPAGKVFKALGVAVPTFEFAQNFACLGPPNYAPRAENAASIALAILAEDEFKVGTSVIFVRPAALRRLQAAASIRRRIAARQVLKANWGMRMKHKKAVVLQAAVRGHICRIRLDDQRSAELLATAMVNDLEKELELLGREENPASPSPSPPQAMPAPMSTVEAATGPVEPFDLARMRSFLSLPLEASFGIMQCTVRRVKGALGGADSFSLSYEPSGRELMTARREASGKYAIYMSKLLHDEKGTRLLGKLKPSAGNRVFTLYDDGVNPAKRKQTGNPRLTLANLAVSLSTAAIFSTQLTRPRCIELSFYYRMAEKNRNCHCKSVVPTWDSDAGYYVLEFYKDRVKRQSVKNFMLETEDKAFIAQFGRSDMENRFVLDVASPASLLVVFGTAIMSSIVAM
jgi:myosin-5